MGLKYTIKHIYTIRYFLISRRYSFLRYLFKDLWLEHEESVKQQITSWQNYVFQNQLILKEIGVLSIEAVKDLPKHFEIVNKIWMAAYNNIH